MDAGPGLYHPSKVERGCCSAQGLAPAAGQHHAGEAVAGRLAQTRLQLGHAAHLAGQPHRREQNEGLGGLLAHRVGHDRAGGAGRHPRGHGRSLLHLRPVDRLLFEHLARRQASGTAGNDSPGNVTDRPAVLSGR